MKQDDSQNKDLQRGLALYRAKEFDQAYIKFMKYAELDPVIGYGYRSLCLYELREIKNAKKDMHRAFKEAYRHDRINELIDLIFDQFPEPRTFLRGNY